MESESRCIQIQGQSGTHQNSYETIFAVGHIKTF